MPAWYPGTYLGFIELFSFFIVFYVLSGNPSPNVLLPFPLSSFLCFLVLSSPLYSRVTESLYSRSLCQPWLLLWRSKLSRYSGQGFHRGTQQRTFLTFSLQDYSRAPFSLCSNKCFPTGPPGTLVMFDSNLWPFLCTGHYNLVSPGTNKICTLGYHCPVGNFRFEGWSGGSLAALFFCLFSEILDEFSQHCFPWLPQSQ